MHRLVQGFPMLASCVHRFVQGFPLRASCVHRLAQGFSYSVHPPRMGIILLLRRGEGGARAEEGRQGGGRAEEGRWEP